MGFFTIPQLCYLSYNYPINHPSLPWDFSLPRSHIVAHSLLRLSHSFLLSHYFTLSLYSSPFCILHPEELVYNLHHILFVCSSLSFYINLSLSQLRYFSYFSQYSFYSELPFISCYLCLYFLRQKLFITNAGFLI